MTALITGLLLLLSIGADAIRPKYGVTTKADKDIDFSTLKTYAWTPGWRVSDLMVDEQIVAAVDRELATLGFSKGTAEKSDVTVTYASLRRTDVDLKSKARAPDGSRPSYPVATLVVLLREPGTTRELFRGRLDAPLDFDPTALNAMIDKSVARMFAAYPTRRHSSHR